MRAYSGLGIFSEVLYFWLRFYRVNQGYGPCCVREILHEKTQTHPHVANQLPVKIFQVHGQGIFTRNDPGP